MTDSTPFFQRNVVQWVLAYLVAAWGVLEALGFFAELFGWSPSIVRAAAVLLGAGLAAVGVIAWNHGARGRQTVTRGEVAVLAVIAAVGVGAAVVVAPTAPDAASSPFGPDGDALRVALAVLPPTDLSPQPQADYFVTGMHEGLISQVAQVSGFRVISRTSSSRFAGSATSLAEIGAQLGVDEVVESTLDRSADTVRLQVRLVRLEPEEDLAWAGEFSAPVRDLVRLQADVARSLAREANVDVTPGERSRLEDAPVVDPDTYADYLRGLYAIMEGTPERVEEGVAILEAAVARNPADPWVYVGLATGLTTLGHSPFSRGGIWPRAQEAAERAVALAPDLAEAHAVLAETKTYWERDWVGAERAFRRANELNPNLAMNRYHYAWFLNLFDRNEEALVQHRMAAVLDPLTPLHTSWLAPIYLAQDPPDVTRALEAVDAGLAIPGGGPVPVLVQGLVYQQLGRADEAVDVLQPLVEVLPPMTWPLALSLARAGRTSEAEALRDRLEASDPTAWDAFGLILVNAALGDLDRAFEWTEHRPAHGWLPWLRTLDWAAPLYADPRFDAFIESMNLPPVRPPSERSRISAEAEGA